MKSNKRQQPIEACDPMPPPPIDVIGSMGGAARAIHNLTMGWLATKAKKIDGPIKGAGHSYLMTLKAPALDADGQWHMGDIEVPVFADLDTKNRQGPLVLGGTMGWEDAHTAVMSVLVNRTYAPLEIWAHVIPVYYEFLYVIAHEMGHILDEKNTREASSYAKSKGQMWGHRYEHDCSEMRARLWGCEVTYVHAYLWMKYWFFDDEEAKELPTPDDDLDFWKAFFLATPARGRPTRALSDDNASFVAARVRESVREIEANGVGDRPPLPNELSGIAQGLGMREADPDTLERDTLTHFRNVMRALEAEDPNITIHDIDPIMKFEHFRD